MGRQAEGLRLAAGQFLLVSGIPGVDKSRLLRDFLAAQGPLDCFQGRPGDEAVPHLSLSRAFRALLPLVPAPALALEAADGSKARLLMLDDFQFCDESRRQVCSVPPS